MSTRLTKSGQPAMSTQIEVKTSEGWEACTVVGKAWGNTKADLVALWVQWSDDARQYVPWRDLEWRRLGQGANK